MKRLTLLCVITILILGVFSPIQAQDDPAAKLEALAVRTHFHNAMSMDFTIIPGAELGTETYLKPTLEQGSVWDTWELPGLGEEQDTFSLADIERPTLINFWASWCGPCRMEFPLLLEVALHPEDHAYDVVFVNSLDESKSIAEETIQNELARLVEEGQASGVHFLYDEGDTLFSGIGSPGIPTSILVDTDGTVLALQVGNFTSVQAAMLEIIAANPDITVGPLDPTTFDEPEVFVEVQPFEDAAPITIGDEVSGTIDSDNVQQVYSFEGSTDDVVTVHMDAALLPQGDDPMEVSTLEPYVVLIGPDGEVVAESRDFLYEVFAEVADVVLPADGLYTVVATRYMGADGISAGDYTLTVTQN